MLAGAGTTATPYAPGTHVQEGFAPPGAALPLAGPRLREALRAPTLLPFLHALESHLRA